jgi:RNA polymerase sigma-70 factor (ECF subfamily)
VSSRTPAYWRSLSDQEVVQHAVIGRDSAYRELIRRYERPVFSLIYRMVRDRELAEDLAQETFVKVLNAIDSYRPEYKFSSWIFKIANNAAIDQLRKRSLDTLSLDGSPHAESADAIEATTLQIGDARETALDEVTSRELGLQIEAAISQLRPEYRSCILLRHVDGRPYEEIAEILGLPLGTVKTYIHRARNELRILLSDTRDE